MKSNQIIKFVSVGALFLITATTLWYIFRPIENSDAFLIIKNSGYEALDAAQKTKIDKLIVDRNYSCNDANCSIQINLNKIVPLTDVEVHQTLEEFKKIICYDHSYPFIEGNHKVLDSDTNRIALIENNKLNTENFGNLFNLVQQPVFYGSYINFKQDTSGNVKPYYKTGYKSGDIALSTPTIYGIYKQNNMANATDYEVTYSLYDHKKHIGLLIRKINDPSVKPLYYNYSTDPTRPIDVMFNPSFALY